MPSQQHPPTTPSPKSGKTGKITDYFKATHQSEAKHAAKRELDVQGQEDAQPTKRAKRSDDQHAGTIKTARYQANVNTPKTRKPASARLLDDTDGGLRDSLVGRSDFLEETGAEDDAGSQHENPKSSVPVHAPMRVNQPRRKRPASSRLLDDVDGGLLESLVGRFKTPRHAEEVFEHREEKSNNASTHYTVGNNTVDDDTEAETEIEDTEVDRSDDNSSSDENRDDDDTEEYRGEGEDSEGDDSDKENVDPRDRYRTPSLPPLPATPGHNQNHETADSTPSNQPPASPSSFLLPSPVVDLPPLPSTPSSSSTLAPEHPSTLPSPPSSP